MPRRIHRCPKADNAPAAALDSDVRDALCYGHQPELGGAQYWETLARCLACWKLHGAKILQDEAWGSSGIRPIAWYLSTATPLRSASDAPTFRLGSITINEPSPLLPCEGQHLYALGMIDDDELGRHYANGTHDTHCSHSCPHAIPPRRRQRPARA